MYVYNRRRASRDPYDYNLPPAAALTVTLLIATCVELLRYQLHPEMYAVLAHPKTLAAMSVILTTAYHLWNMPDGYRKIIASTFFTEASMPSVLLICVTFLQQLATAFVLLLSNVIAGVPPK